MIHFIRVSLIALFFVIQSLWAMEPVRPLFVAYPALQKTIPHKPLAIVPTPLKYLERISNTFDAQVWCKDDGKTGDIFGGNKVRKLEFLLAEAIAKKASTVITLGGAGSNHAAATAAYAHKLGLQARLLLTPQMITQYARRNLLLDMHFNAEIEYFAGRQERERRLDDLQKDSRNYVIPVGGSNELGQMGFVNAAFELKKQCDELKMAYPDYIYVPYGSYGTITGLLVGLKAAGLKCTVVGVCTDEASDPAEELKHIVERARALNNYVRKYDDRFPECVFSVNDVSVRLPRSEYAEVTKPTREALMVMKNAENIQLDTTYSGKAFAALWQDLNDNTDAIRNKRVLFWKTYADGVYESATRWVDYKQLPEALHHYFEDPLQRLDDQGY